MTARPEAGQHVLVITGGIETIAWALHEGLHGFIVELANGLFVEVEPNADTATLIRWREIPERKRPWSTLQPAICTVQQATVSDGSGRAKRGVNPPNPSPNRC